MRTGSNQLPETVRALRAQLAQLNQTLAHLERNLSRKDRPVGSSTTPRTTGFFYELFGQRFRVADGTELLVEVLRHFAEFDSNFPEAYRATLRPLGRVRPYVARSRDALYPGHPDLHAQSAEFAPGWFVGTNESNLKKRDLLRIACDVIGLRWNVDLKVNMG